jgi:hypothetical protein
MSWPDLKENANQRKTALDSATTDSAIDSLANQINRSINQYASTGGISSDPNKNQAYIDTNSYFSQLIELNKQYEQLNRELTDILKNMSSNSNISSKLQKIGSLRNDIANLEKTLKDVTNDVDVSKNRKESVENTELNVSWYQGFASRVGLTKPLHSISIPILIGFGIFLLIMSGLMLKEVIQFPGQSSDQTYDSESLFSLFNASRLYTFIGVFAFIIVVLGILSYNGYFGKSMN